MIKIKDIKKVAIYIRKSRLKAEEDDILVKHTELLTNICKSNGWKYDIYIENESTSSQSIKYREKLPGLLKKLKDYDGLMVVEQSRLSRKTGVDVELKQLLIDNNCFLIIQHRIMDLTNSDDSRMFDVNSFVNSMEYTAINDRLQLGKQLSFKAGKWYNGPAPFGYYYDKNKKALVINKEEKKVYDYIKKHFIINKWSTNQIAYSLNKKGRDEDEKWLTRKGKYWSNKTIIDILTNEVYLGYVIHKQEGSQHKDRPVKEYKILDEAIKVKSDNVPVLMKPEELETILFRLQQSRLNDYNVKNFKSKEVYTLSGLVQCGLCGRLTGMSKRNNGEVYLRKCPKQDEFGENKCPNGSINARYMEETLLDDIKEHYEQLKLVVSNDKLKEELEDIRANEISKLEEEKVEIEKALKFVYDRYEAGIYDDTDFIERRKDKKEALDEVIIKLNGLRIKEGELTASIEQDILSKYVKVIADLQNQDIGTQEKNNELKEIIHKILYTRTGGKDAPFTAKVIFKY